MKTRIFLITVFYALSFNFFAQNNLFGTVIDQSGNPSFQPPFSVLRQFDLNKGHSFGFQMNIPVLNGFATKNNVERSKVALDRSKIAFSQQELDLERNIYTAFTDAKGAMKAYESAIITLEARQEAYNYAKEKFAVGMLNFIVEIVQKRRKLILDIFLVILNYTLLD